MLPLVCHCHVDVWNLFHYPECRLSMYGSVNGSVCKRCMQVKYLFSEQSHAHPEAITWMRQQAYRQNVTQENGTVDLHADTNGAVRVLALMLEHNSRCACTSGFLKTVSLFLHVRPSGLLGQY